MNIYEILLLVIIFTSFIIPCYEMFDVVSYKEFTTWETPYIPNIPQSQPQKACCLVQKKYLPDNTGLYGGNFKYKFTKLINEDCDYSRHNIDATTQLFFEGENDWSNIQCSNSNNNIGSCRNINKECVDFVTQSYCSKYLMKWSKKTCSDPLDYVWVDPIKLILPKPQNGSDGSFIMFNKKVIK